MKHKKKTTSRGFLLLILFFLSTSLLSLKTLKKVNIQDIKIYGSKLFSQNDLVNNSSLKLPIRLIFIKTNFIEKELKQNLSLKNVSISRQILPFSLEVYVNTRTPIAYSEKILNGKKIFGYVDKDGFFINKQNLDEKSLKSPDYIFEPNQSKIVNELLPKALSIKFFKALRDSFASEHGARMTAMHKATDNATELRDQLKLTYNKARQAAITNEILEIVGGAEALES